MSRTDSPLAPLLASPRAADIAQRLAPFREQGALESLDVHVVDHLGALVGEEDPEVLLGLALAVRAPRKGHICVDLETLVVGDLLPEPDDTHAQRPTPPRLPEDRAEWLRRIRRSPLVRGRGGEGRARPFVLDGTRLYPDRYFTYQERLAAALTPRFAELQPPRDAALLRGGLEVLFPPGPAGDDASRPGLDRQKLAAAMAVLRGLTVISGGPGTGKTYTVRSVLALLWAQWAVQNDPDGDQAGPRVALAAPTGKAAARMKEAILAGLETFLDRASGVIPPGRNLPQLRRFLASLLPSTLHRLLRWNPASPSRFRHDAANPLPFEVVVVDETSMVDFALMTKLVDAVGQGARLILLGDQHQLASVEAGTVLADLCGPTSVKQVTVSEGFARELQELAGLAEVSAHAELSRAPGPYDAIVQLERSRRFTPDSGIGRFAKACLADDFSPSQAVELLAERRPDSDVTLCHHGPSGVLPEDARRIVVHGYLPYLERLLEGARPGEMLAAFHAEVLEQFDRFRILCAHRRGRLGVAGMNKTVVELLASARKDDTSRSPSATGSARLAGFEPEGEFWVGRPVLVTRNDYVARLFNGDVGIVVRDAVGEKKVVFLDPEGVRYVAPARLPDHETVFAMTIHKSQGSEFEHAMVVLPGDSSPVLTKELVYTGVTRARSRLTILCDPHERVLREALGKPIRRASGLREELWGKGGDSHAVGPRHCA